MEIKIRVEESKNNIGVSLKDNIVIYRESGREPQEKQVEYTENGTYEVKPDADHILEKVNVNVNVPIPDGYVKPEGAIEITANGEVDVTNYEKAKVNVPQEIDTFLEGNLSEYVNHTAKKLKYGFCNNYSITSVTFTNVEEVGDRTFSGCAKLEHINMPKVKKVGPYGFHGTKINADNPIFSTIEEWEGTNQFYSLATKGEINMPKITTVSNACFASASITRFRADNVTSVGNQAFATTSNLETVELPNCETLGNQVFQSSKIKYISLPKVKKLATQLFNGATALETAEFDSLESISGGMTFYNCSSLKALILRNNLVVTFGQANSFDGSGISKGTGFVYVPDDLVDSYKAATNWSKYAEQIKGLSEYIETT